MRAKDLNDLDDSRADLKKVEKSKAEIKKTVNFEKTLYLNKSSFFFSLQDVKILNLGKNEKNEEELKKLKEISNSLCFRATSVLFIIRLTFYHFFICTSQAFPRLNISFMIIFEIILIFVYFKKLIKFWKISQKLKIFSKIIQSLATLSFLILCFILKLQAKNYYEERNKGDLFSIEEFEPLEKLQNFGIKIFILIILSEYFFILVLCIDQIIFLITKCLKSEKIEIELKRIIVYLTKKELEELRRAKEEEEKERKRREKKRKFLENEKKKFEKEMNEADINLIIEKEMREYRPNDEPKTGWITNMENNRDYYMEGALTRYQFLKMKARKEKILQRFKNRGFKNILEKGKKIDDGWDFGDDEVENKLKNRKNDAYKKNHKDKFGKLTPKKKNKKKNIVYPKKEFEMKHQLPVPIKHKRTTESKQTRKGKGFWEELN